MSNMVTKRWVLLAVIFALLWGFAEVRYWQLRHRLSNLWVASPSVKVVDQASGAVLPATIGGIPGLSGGEDYLPHVVVGLPDGGVGASRITVASDQPLKLQISAEGYEAQPLVVSRSSPGEVTLKLKKK